MNSDVLFEEIGQEAQEFRAPSSDKTLVLSFSITLFLLLISIIVRFYFDDKIYGENEIRLYFKKLNFVGEVPAFEN